MTGKGESGLQMTTVYQGLLAVLVLLPLLVAGLWFVHTASFTSWDFRNNLWGPAHLLVKGESPYRIELLFDGSNAVWMPAAVGAFLPLGLLSQKLATNLWLIFTIVLLLVGVALSVQKAQPGVLPVALVLVAALIFPPTVSHFILGQFSLVAMTLLLAAARLVARGRLWPAGLLIALALAKPQLVLLPLVGLSIICWQQGGWRWVFRLGLIAALWALLFMLPLWLIYPGWVEGFQAALGRNYVWAHPSLLLLLNERLGAGGQLIWLMAAVTALIINWRLWRDLPAQRAIAWSLALNLLITPYVWSWDFVLLLPLLVQTAFVLHWRWLQVLLLAVYAGCWGGIVMIRLYTDNDDVRFWWVPWVLIAGVLLVDGINRRRQHADLVTAYGAAGSAAECLPVTAAGDDLHGWGTAARDLRPHL